MSYLRLLFWLKWTLMWRGFRRSKSAAVGIILSIFFFFPLALAIAGGCVAGFLALKPPLNEHLLRGVLLGIYLFWLLLPLLGYALNDSYDLTKLFLYPLSVRQIFVGAILGSLVDFPILFVLPTLLAVLLGFTRSVLALAPVLLSVGLFLFHTLSLSQAILLVSAGVLRSRRFRDVLIVLVPLFWMCYYVASQMLTRQMVHVNWSRFLDSRTWEVLNFLPSGFAARAIAAAGRGDTVLSLGFLLGLAAFTVGTVYLAGWLIQKVYIGEVISAPVRKRAARGTEGRPTGLPAQAKGRPTGLPLVGSVGSVGSLSGAEGRPTGLPLQPARAAFGVRLPPVVEAVADKEIKYLCRDPYFKVVLMFLVYMLFIVAFVFLRPGSSSLRNFTPAMVWGVTGMVLLSEMQLLFNLFGTEGGSAAVLFLFPSSRRQMLIGKNLVLFAALSVVHLVFMGVLSALAGALHLFGPLFCWMELATVVFLAVGNLVSVWFPLRVVLRGWRMHQQNASRGCGYGFLYLGIAALALALLLPVLAALLGPTFWIHPAWLALTIPFAAAYAFGLYALSLHLAEPLLLQREIEIVEKLGAEE